MKMQGVVAVSVLEILLTVAAYENMRSRVIVVNEGHQTELPCETRSPVFNSTQDAVRVEWFHLGGRRRSYGSREPIYTLDFGGATKDGHRTVPNARANLLQVVRWARSEWQGRAYFHLVGYPFSLKVTGLRYEDTGEYLCSVTFRDGAIRNASVILQVVVPPEPPVITDEAGRRLRGTIGPYDEGSRLDLLCQVKGGKPSPMLTWKRNGEYYPVKTSISVSGDGKQSKLVIPSLQRSDLMATYSCFSSNNISAPMEVSVTLELNLSPLVVQIRKSEAPISSGLTAEILCEVWGSRPPPEITWWKNSVQLNQTFMHVSQDENLTTSVMAFAPQRVDNGQNLVCHARNPRLLNSAKEDHWELSVHYRPLVQLKLAQAQSHSNVRERMDVTLLCIIDGNPPGEDVKWTFNDAELRPSELVHTNHRNILLIRNVSTMNTGNYSCSATNTEGTGYSDVVFIHVKHTPICRPNQRVVYTAARAQEVDVSCEVDAYPPLVNFLWQFNSTGQSHQVENVFSNGTLSTARYSALSNDDYGTLLCWARNEVGRQEMPCRFLIVPQGTRLKFSDETLLTMLISAVTVLFLLPLCIFIAIRMRNKRHEAEAVAGARQKDGKTSGCKSGKSSHSNGGLSTSKADDYWISRETAT